MVTASDGGYDHLHGGVNQVLGSGHAPVRATAA
jgi:hypothetical protein